VAGTSTHIYWVTSPIAYETDPATVYRLAK
jgi:hypothetical protein